MNTLPGPPAPPRPSSTSSLHDLTTKPLPPHNSRSSASTTMPRLSPAVVVLRLCHRSFVDCYFFVIVISAVVAPLPPNICRVSSAAIVLQTVAPSHPPPRPASCQLPSSSAFAAAHLLIVVFCNCRQRHCSLSTTNPPPHLFSSRCPPPHPPLSATSSYCCP